MGHSLESAAASESLEDSKQKVYDVDVDVCVHAHELTKGDSWTAKLQRFAGKFKIEQRGIERVPEDERTDTNGIVKVGTMWLATNMVVTSFAVGALATPVFALGFVDTILTIFFFNILGAIPVAFFSTFGPVFGLRQMVLSRFYFGYHGVKIISMFNILSSIGWSCVNTIVGAQLLHAVNHNVPGYGGILILAAATLLVSLFGYKVIHAYEFWSWIPSFIVMLIILGEFAHSGAYSDLPMGVGTSEAASVLSFAASVFGFATSWVTYAADYTCYQPTTTSSPFVFLSSLCGLLFPLLFTQMLGAAIMTASISQPTYATGYADAGMGGLLAAVLFPPLGGFGKFCLVVLALSTVACNCPNMYSVSLSMQMMGRWSARVPRFVWTLSATIAYVAISIPGYSHFESVLENFMLIIAYWIAIYEGVSLTEHFLFKRSIAGYRPAIYDTPALLPPGTAAISASCVGAAGAVLGMAQVWFTGPIGKMVGGPFGGDIGFELGFGFTALSYALFRKIELSVFRR
jgi:NCS1 nucleoside transporter family